MSNRFLASMGVLVAVIAVVSLTAVPVAGQARPAASTAAGTSTPSRTPDGHPDLQGIWRFATLTPLERPEELAGKPVLTDEEAATLEEQAAQNRYVDRPSKPGNPLSQGYNRFWAEDGTKVVGTKRTSLVVDPPDGKVPPLTPEAQKREDARAEARHLAAGPEDLTVYDRCILGFNSGPPIIPSSPW